MKLLPIAIVLLLPFMNACVDDTTAEDPVAPMFYTIAEAENPETYRIADIYAIAFQGNFHSEPYYCGLDLVGGQAPRSPITYNIEDCRQQLQETIAAMGIDVNDGSWVHVSEAGSGDEYLNESYLRSDQLSHFTHWADDTCELWLYVNGSNSRFMATVRNSYFLDVPSLPSLERCVVAGMNFVKENFGGGTTVIVGELDTSPH